MYIIVCVNAYACTDFISTDQLSRVNEIVPTALGALVPVLQHKTGSCSSTSTKRSVQSSAVKPKVLPKNGGRPRNCSETLGTCLAEKCLRSLLSILCVLFSCEDNLSVSNSDCVYIERICTSCVTVQCGCVGPDRVGNGKTRCLP